MWDEYDYSFDVPDYSFDAPDYSYSAPDYSYSAPDYGYTAPDYFANDYSFASPDYGVSQIDTSTPSWAMPTYDNDYDYDYSYDYSPSSSLSSSSSVYSNDPYAYLNDPYATAYDTAYDTTYDPYATAYDPYAGSKSLGGEFEPVKMEIDSFNPNEMDPYDGSEAWKQRHPDEWRYMQESHPEWYGSPSISTSAADIAPSDLYAAVSPSVTGTMLDTPVVDTLGPLGVGTSAATQVAAAPVAATPSGVAGVDEKITTENGETYVKDPTTGSYVKVSPDTTALDSEATYRSIGPNINLAKESSGLNLADLEAARAADDAAQGAVLRDALGYKTTQYDDGSTITTDKDGKVVRVTDSEGKDVAPAVAAKSPAVQQQQQQQGPQARVGTGTSGGGGPGPQKSTPTPAQKGIDAALLGLLALLASKKGGTSGPAYGIPKLTMERLQNAVRGGNMGQRFFGSTAFRKDGGMVGCADGGIMSGLNSQELQSLGGYSDGGRLLRGPGDGVSDSIPARIGAKQEARLADGEFVVPARIVSELGNGSTDAGARKLYEMMDRVQHARKQTIGKNNVAVNSRAARHLPK